MPRTLRTNNKASVPGGVLLSASPEKAMNEMMETIDLLRDVYVEENKALENVDTKGFMDLQEKKLETAKLYQRGIEEIVARKEEMRRVDPTLKRRLERMQEDFSTIAAENKEALKRMQRTVERLTETIRSAAKDAVNQHQATSYGDSGRLHSSEKRIVSTGVSETA